MANLFGVIGLNDNDYVSSANEGKLFDAVNAYAARTEAEVNAAFAAFVEGDTTDYISTYFLPSGGMMQEAAERSRPGAVKPTGEWEVGFPLRDARDQLAWTDISRAYMTAAKFSAQVQGIANRYVNWKRFSILKALLNNSNETFVDPVFGSITVRRLANTDGTLYPAVIGSSSEAEEAHYVETNYLSASISDTNNPIRDFIKAELSEHFGSGRYAAWVNSAQTSKLSALATFDPVKPEWVTPGATADVASTGGAITGPGQFIGAISDVAIFEWNWIPANYIFGINIDAPKPLERRVDAVESLRGFRLVAEQDEYPLRESFWRAREGYGVANRLNGVVAELGTGGTFTVPTAFA